MKTGNTCQKLVHRAEPVVASMEPGHEDREYWDIPAHTRSDASCLNGARS